MHCPVQGLPLQGSRDIYKHHLCIVEAKRAPKVALSSWISSTKVSLFPYRGAQQSHHISLAQEMGEGHRAAWVASSTAIQQLVSKLYKTFQPFILLLTFNLSNGTTSGVCRFEPNRRPADGFQLLSVRVKPPSCRPKLSYWIPLYFGNRRLIFQLSRGRLNTAEFVLKTSITYALEMVVPHWQCDHVG